MKYKVIIISDLHLATKDAKVRQVIRFLKENPCELLILNGDIIDGWRLKRRGKWKKRDTQFFKVLLDLLGKYKSKVVYLRGNHDEFIDEIAPMVIGNFEIRREMVLTVGGGTGTKRYIVIHGDIFDVVTSRITWLSKLGGVGYELLLAVNRSYNRKRLRKGLPYRSIAQAWKDNVKMVMKYLSKFETKARNFTRYRRCNGIICGHVHKPEDKMLGEIHYLNSGDWVETMSALVLDYENQWMIIYYQDNPA